RDGGDKRADTRTGQLLLLRRLEGLALRRHSHVRTRGRQLLYARQSGDLEMARSRYLECRLRLPPNPIGGQMTDTLSKPELTDAEAIEARIRADDRAHVFHSWSAQEAIDPLPIASASGSYFWDYSGKRYLDFASQLVNVNIGHQHPKLIAAIIEQASKPTTVSPAFA